MARLRLLGLAIAVAGLLRLTAGPASAGGSRHPLFDDQGALTWYTSLDEAQAAARATGKLIFIESGRRACGNCRHVVEQVLPASNVRSRIGAIAIGLADDCDESDARVSNMLGAGVPDATVLPLCGFVTPELRWVTGFSGYMDPASFSGHLSRAEIRFEQVKKIRRTPATPPVCPAPPPVYVRPVPAPPLATPLDPPLVPEPTPTPRPIPQAAPRPAPAPPPPFAAPTRPSAPVPPAPAAPSPTPPSVTPVPGPIAALPKTSPAMEPAVAQPKRPVMAMLGGPMERARHAAAEGKWGEVMKVNDDSLRLAAADRAELEGLLRRANDWVFGSFEAAIRSAKAHKYPEAKRTLTVLATQLSGTTCPGLIDAERGLRAVDRLLAIEQGAPEQADAPEQLRKSAYADFRGSRWAPLFKGRVSSAK